MPGLRSTLRLTAWSILTLACLLAGRTAGHLAAQEPPAPTDQGKAGSAADIARWIDLLDADDYRTRVTATRKLREAGLEGLEALMKATAEGSLEKRMRAVEVLTQLLDTEDPEKMKILEKALVQMARDENNPFSEKAYAMLSRYDTTSFTNVLQPGDEQDNVRNGCFRKVYQVKMAADSNYAIDLTGNYDTYLRVENAAGQNLAMDDDGGEGLNSRLMFRPGQDGTYKVIVTSCGAGAQGAFTLTVRRVRDTRPGSHQTFAGNLAATDPRDPVRGGSFQKVHEIKMKASRSYLIDLQGSFDTYIRVEDAQKTNLAEDDDGGDGLNSRLTFRPNRDGTYRVIVTSFGSGATGNYNLTVSEGR